MAVTTSVRFKWDRKAIAELKTYEPLLAEIRRAADGFAQHERALAPKNTGAGSASIIARESKSKGARDVGWDPAHHYMSFPNYGTKYLPTPQLFAQRTLADYLFT